MGKILSILAACAVSLTAVPALAGGTYGDGSYGVNDSYGVNLLFGISPEEAEELAAAADARRNAKTESDNINVTVNVVVINEDSGRSYRRNRPSYVSISDRKSTGGRTIDVVRYCDREWRITRDRYGREKRTLIRRCDSFDSRPGSRYRR